ncbi:MAG: molybdate ABC transporter substrate-binding protein [Elainellaceae cyanobacterium]
MKRRHVTTFWVSTVVTCLAAMSCTRTAVSPTTETTGTALPEEPVELTVSVAASVQDAMRDMQTAYQAEFPNVAITYNFGPSGSLAQQIAQGAPTDIFLSASKKWMDDLEEQGQILGSRQDLLLNALVVIVPQDKTDIADVSDFATDKVSKMAIAEPDSVPAGRYAKEALTSLNLFDTLQSKLVFGKDVRQVLSYVETGNVDAGLVYATDAKISDQVRVVTTVPADTHSPIIYPVGVVADSENAEAAQAFIDFLSMDVAIAIFEDYGFMMAE